MERLQTIHKAYHHAVYFKHYLGLPSKARGKYQKRKLLSEEQKAKILRARNRDNARRTRKRKKLYVNFIDKALKALETALGGTSSSSASQSSKPEDDGRSDNDNDESCQDMEDVKQEQISRVSGKSDSHSSSSSSSDYSRQRKNSSTAVEIDNSSRSSSSFPPAHSLEHVKDERQINSDAAAPSSENDLTSKPSGGTEMKPDTHDTASSEGERRKLRTPVPRCSMESSVTKSNLLAKRVRYMRAYLKLRHSPPREPSESGPGPGPDSPSKVAEWLTVCAAEVVHVTPLPAYRQAKDLHQMGSCPPDCMYECRGVDAVAMDCQRIAEYFDTLRGASTYENPSSCEEDVSHCKSNSGSAKSKLHRHWFASFAMDSDNATLCDNGSTLLVGYTLTVQIVDKQSSLKLKSDCTSPRVFPYHSPAPASTQPRVAAVTAGNSLSPSPYRQLESASSSGSSSSSSSRAPVAPQRLDQRKQTDCKSEDDVEADQQEDKDDDDICKWLEMALDTTYIRDPSYQRHRTVSVGRDFSEQEIARLSHTGSVADDDCESDSDGEEWTSSDDRKAKRSKFSSSGTDTDMCEATEIEPPPAASGTVLFRLCIQARVEFGGIGCDSDGRILRITEHFSAPRDSAVQ